MQHVHLEIVTLTKAARTTTLGALSAKLPSPRRPDVL
jgi:hypothetical protein